MQIISKTTDIQIGEKKSAIAIGKFDGIHIGHRKILDEIIKAKENGMQAVIFTFDPSPEEYFGGTMIPVLDTKEEKRIKFEQAGVDVLVEFPLTEKTVAISPESFIKDILVDKLNAGLVVSGTDLSFGYMGKGNAQLLSQFSILNHFDYKMVDKVCVDGKEVSSTRIRNQVAKGNMDETAALLGEAYRISGYIVHGNHIGHTLGMPTVNILPQHEKLLPPNGVYVTLSETKGKSYYGITNIGYKPTVSKERVLGVETYLYDFDGNLYGEKIDTRIIHYMRPEQKFSNIEELKKQLALDKEKGMMFLKKYHS